jgi:hypothetical protein
MGFGLCAAGKTHLQIRGVFWAATRVRMAKVTVHSVEAWDINRGDWATLPFKTTEKGIEELPHTAGLPRIVPGTAEEVDASELDTHGRYYPKRSHTE